MATHPITLTGHNNDFKSPLSYLKTVWPCDLNCLFYNYFSEETKTSDQSAHERVKLYLETCGFVLMNLPKPFWSKVVCKKRLGLM